MRTYSIVETRTFCGGMGGNKKSILHPQINILYSCTDEIQCRDCLDKIAFRYLNKGENLKDFFYKKNADYHFPDRKGHYNVSLYIKECNLVFNSDHNDEQTDFIGGLYDRIAYLMIAAGDKTETEENLEFSIPVNNDAVEIATGFCSLTTEGGYEINKIVYESYDNGHGQNGEIFVYCEELDELVEIINLSDSMTCALANYVEWFYDRKMN